MRVRIMVRPTGAYNGAEWPQVGEVIDLPEHVAVGMLNAGSVEAVRSAKAETATAPVQGVETADVKTTPKAPRKTTRKG